MRFTLDHLGLARSSGRDDEAFRSMDQVLRLGEIPSAAIKVSAIPLFVTDAYPHRVVHSHLRRIQDAFGPKRMFWDSDLSRLSCPYRQVVTMFTERMPWLTAEDKEWIMGRGLCEWISWE